jgi:hypothetical protein
MCRARANTRGTLLSLILLFRPVGTLQDGGMREVTRFAIRCGRRGHQGYLYCLSFSPAFW